MNYQLILEILAALILIGGGIYAFRMSSRPVVTHFTIIGEGIGIMAVYLGVIQMGVIFF